MTDEPLGHEFFGNDPQSGHCCGRSEQEHEPRSRSQIAKDKREEREADIRREARRAGAWGAVVFMALAGVLILQILRVFWGW